MLMTSKKKPSPGVGSLQASGHILHFDLASSDVRHWLVSRPHLLPSFVTWHLIPCNGLLGKVYGYHTAKRR